MKNQNGESVEKIFEEVAMQGVAAVAAGSAVSRPLPAGTEIEYCGHRATVVEDHGRSLIVDCEGDRMMWYWRFCGAECSVLSSPNNSGLPRSGERGPGQTGD